MICSILITSRKRVPRLLKTLQSIRDTAISQDDIEVLLRFDDDDLETEACIPAYKHIVKNFSWIKGPRLNGWQSVAAFWDELYKKSNGTWSWMMSDDMIVTGKGWDILLHDVPTEGFIVHPQIHQLGGSTYTEDATGPAPIIPKGALEKFGYDCIPNPPDTGINDSFRRKSGWEIKFLPGIGVWHMRDDESELFKERLH